MDTKKLIDLLKATIDLNQRQQAEDQLNQIHKIIGFAPSLLQVVMMSDVEMPVRQAGVIYLKNLVTQFWAEKEAEPGQPLPFTLHEQDRAMVRESIVDAVVLAPELVRVQLSTCVNNMVKHDFPHRWTQIVDKISIYLQNPDPNGWMGALICLYQLVKIFEYRKLEERGPLSEAMNMLLPMIYQLIVRLLPDPSEQSVLLQKQILKIFFALTQYSLPLDLVTRDVFSQWMEVCRAVVGRPVPDHLDTLDEDDKAECAWWKCKKWALHILQRMFERYGSPGFVTKEYKDFAEWYIKTFSAGILEVLLGLLDQHRRKVFVSPRVLRQTLKYIEQGVKHALTWRLLKPHMPAIIQEVLFPVMCYTEEDEDMWTTDPHEYIRIKFDVFEDFLSPVTAAQALLHAVCKKRKDMLQKSMGFVLQVLTANPPADPKLRDGALYMVGSLAEILLKKDMYREQLDKMLCQYVFPEFQSPHGHMRARACWVLNMFNEVQFKQDVVLQEAVRLTTTCLLVDTELPVKVEAAVALQMLITHQDPVQKLIEPQIKPIVLELLKIIRETENDDLTNVMQKIVCSFAEQLAPIAVEICEHLAATFLRVLETDEGSDEKAITAMGLLNTMETLLTVMEDLPEVVAQLQPVVLQVISHVFAQSVMEFYEEALSLVYDLTRKAISPHMWQVLEMMCTLFQRDGFDYFTDMMPALHNYVTVDTEAFLSAESRVLIVWNMCRAVLTGDAGEDPECHAAKLLEVLILQCKGRIDQCIPSIVELVLVRLTREVKTSELRAMCLQVVIAALYYNPHLLFETLDKATLPQAPSDSVTSHFIKQWLHDTDCFLGLHDRKLCVLGLCTLLQINGGRPPALSECAPQIIPALILLFDGLKRAYAAKALEGEEESEEESDDEADSDVLESDEDDIDEDGTEYLEKLEDKVLKGNASSPFQIKTCIADTSYEDCDEDSDDEDYVPEEETVLESYTTPLDDEESTVDEYIIFKEVLAGVQINDPGWYQMLTAQLTPEQQKALQDVFVLADQRKAAAESKRIEQSGGYVFHQQTVPTSFNFGGTPLGR